MFNNPNNKTNSFTKPPKTIKPQSIPTNRRVELELKSQNIFEIFKYQLEHMLEDLDKNKPDPQVRKEEVQPLKSIFKPKKKQHFVSMQEFLDKQYPQLFKPIQAEVPDYPEIKGKRLVRPQSAGQTKVEMKDNISWITQEDLKSELTDVQSFIFDLGIIKSGQTDRFTSEPAERLTLPEILGLKTREQRDAFRALPLVQQKQVIQNNLDKNIVQNPEFKNQVLSEKLEEMSKRMEQTKINLFQIINELDLMNKGVRDIKNKMRQPYALRKKAEQSPRLDKLKDEVKNTIFYNPGTLDVHQKEQEIIKFRNQFIQGHNIDDDNIDQYINEVESDLNAIRQKKPTKIQIINPQHSNKPIKSEKIDLNKDLKIDINDSVNESQFSKATTVSQPQIKISSKAKQMNDLLDVGIFD